MADTQTPAGEGGRADLLGGGIGAHLSSKAAGPQRYPFRPGHKDDGAGKDAADAFAPKLCFRRAEALSVFDRLTSATPDEVAAEIDRPPHVTRPRVSELFLLGELVKTDERRPSAFGASQTVYRRATQAECAVVRARRAAEAEHGEGADR